MLALAVLAVTLAQSWVCPCCHHHFPGAIQFLARMISNGHERIWLGTDRMILHIITLGF